MHLHAEVPFVSLFDLMHFRITQIVHQLHDMSTGLADQRTDFLADGNEWRTPPLWGIGLTKTVNPLAGFLHDGRARTLTEAILWHGGEGQSSRDAFAALLPAERAALLSFLGSL